MQYDNAIMLFIEILTYLNKSWQKTEFDESSSWVEKFESNRILLLKNSDRVELSLENENSTRFND